MSQCKTSIRMTAWTACCAALTAVLSQGLAAAEENICTSTEAIKEVLEPSWFYPPITPSAHTGAQDNSLYQIMRSKSLLHPQSNSFPPCLLQPWWGRAEHVPAPGQPPHPCVPWGLPQAELGRTLHSLGLCWACPVLTLHSASRFLRLCWGSPSAPPLPNPLSKLVLRNPKECWWPYKVLMMLMLLAASARWLHS